MNRRLFLQGLLSAGALAGIGISASPPSAGATFAGPADDHVLVVIMMNGGNDGLDMVIPATNSHYQTARGALALGPSPLPVNESLWFHENLPGISARFGAGEVAVVQGISDIPPDLSHFESMARWMSGHSSGVTPTGWLGRWNDDANTGDFDIVNIGDAGIPRHLRGTETEAVGLPSAGIIVSPYATPWATPYFDQLVSLGAAGAGGGLRDHMASAMANAIGAGAVMTPVLGGAPASGLQRDMTIAANAINLDVGIRVASVSFGDFDTHQAHPDTHPGLMLELDQAIAAFYATLNPALVEKVIIMTVSEFGRSFTANDSAGLDHGTASTSLVIGPNVKGGLYGAQPSFTDLDVAGDLKPEVDFRSLYGSVITDWLGGDSSAILGGAYENLDIFEPVNVIPTNPNDACANPTIVGVLNPGETGAVIYGTRGDDVILGTSGQDEIHGRLGDDIICGGGGDDLLIGGDGDDVLFGQGGSDLLSGGRGNDVAYGNSGNDRIRGGGGNDRLYGHGGADRIAGHSGNDVIHGNDGNDWLSGALGNDVVSGGGGDDEVHGGQGDDNVSGGDGNDLVYGGPGTNVIEP